MQYLHIHSGVIASDFTALIMCKWSMYKPWVAKITFATSIPWINRFLHNLNIQRGGEEVIIAGLAGT